MRARGSPHPSRVGPRKLPRGHITRSPLPITGEGNTSALRALRRSRRGRRAAVRARGGPSPRAAVRGNCTRRRATLPLPHRWGGETPRRFALQLRRPPSLILQSCHSEGRPNVNRVLAIARRPVESSPPARGPGAAAATSSRLPTPAAERMPAHRIEERGSRGHSSVPPPSPDSSLVVRSSRSRSPTRSLPINLPRNGGGGGSQAAGGGAVASDTRRRIPPRRDDRVEACTVDVEPGIINPRRIAIFAFPRRRMHFRGSIARTIARNPFR